MSIKSLYKYIHKYRCCLWSQAHHSLRTSRWFNENIFSTNHTIFIIKDMFIWLRFYGAWIFSYIYLKSVIILKTSFQILLHKTKRAFPEWITGFLVQIEDFLEWSLYNVPCAHFVMQLMKQFNTYFRNVIMCTLYSSPLIFLYEYTCKEFQ